MPSHVPLHPSTRRSGRSVRRAVGAALAAAALGAAPVPVVLASPSCLVPPVEAPVAEPYRHPACRYCPGHRGIDFDTGAGVVVRAAAAGTVDFAGEVAGTVWVVVRHADGRRASYGRLDAVRVRAGSTVTVGERIARTAGRLYFGLRDGDEPVDPTPLLGRWQRRPRLVPRDGSSRPPAPVARLVCPNTSGAG